MSEGERNIKLIREGLEAYAAKGPEALMPMLSEEFEMTTPPSLASEPDTYRGEEGMRRYFDSFFDAMETVEIEGDNFTAVNDKVVIDFTLRAKGRTSGIEAEQHAFMVWTARDGLAVRLEIFPTREEALSAAELK